MNIVYKGHCGGATFLKCLDSVEWKYRITNICVIIESKFERDYTVE